MSGVDPSILDRVRKLLALAGSPNPHEAAAAASRAQALVARHRLDSWLAAEKAEADAAEADPITDGRATPLEVARRVRRWRVVLASVLAEANGCVAWLQEREPRKRPDAQALCVVGREADRELVRALWDGLVKRVEWASASAGAGRDRAWHDAFRIGVADTIARRLADDALAPGEPALVVAAAALARHQQDVDRYVEAHFQARSGKGMLVDPAGYAAGRVAGASLKLG